MICFGLRAWSANGLKVMKRSAIRIITLICGVALAIATLSLAVNQSVQALDAEKPFRQYSHSIWRTENGLPQNTVRAIVQTHDGYIWLATDDGLVRFDGIRLVTFDRQNTPAMKSSVILTLYEDSNRTLWVGTDNGLIEYRNGEFTAYS